MKIKKSVLKESIKEIVAEVLNEGLEKHVDGILDDENIIHGVHYWWENGLNVGDPHSESSKRGDPKMAKKIMKILDDSKEFGPTAYNKRTGQISFGRHQMFKHN